MTDLLNTLLECPNLCLRILDSSTGRAIKVVNGDQLNRFMQNENVGCNKDCDNTACINKATKIDL